MHAFTKNTHGNTLDERKSLATLSRIQTKPWRWTDGDMGTGSLKSHISIYICCLAGESVTAKPNKQLLAKHTHTSQSDIAFSLFPTHTDTHTHLVSVLTVVRHFHIRYWFCFQLLLCKSTGLVLLFAVAARLMVCHQQNDKSHFQVRKIKFYDAEDNNGEVRRGEGIKKEQGNNDIPVGSDL